MSADVIQVMGLFITLAGFVIGLGAVTVIEMLGFLGRKSGYWTEATIRAHKVTKPLIWIGITLLSIGLIIFDRSAGWPGLAKIQAVSIVILVLNGLFLSFVVSPFILQREREGRAQELLPRDLQVKITLSFFVSFIGWWGNLLLLVWYLSSKH